MTQVQPSARLGMELANGHRMRHFAARTVPDRLLFTSWADGLHVWRLLTAAAPGAVVCLMPDHV